MNAPLQDGRRTVSFWKTISSDMRVNRGNTKGQLVVVAFRFAHWLRCRSRVTCWLGIPYLVTYRILVEWLMGIEIPPLTRIGPGLILNHGQGLVINNKVIIGSGCRLRHGVTIGNKTKDGECPELGDEVEIGANAVVLGALKIGNRAVIGAGAIVTKDVPADQVVVGNPARVIARRDSPKLDEGKNDRDAGRADVES